MWLWIYIIERWSALSNAMDIRTYLFEPLAGESFVAEISAVEPGVSGWDRTRSQPSAELGLNLDLLAPDGASICSGSPVSASDRLRRRYCSWRRGTPGLRRKASGVATAAFRLLAQANGNVRIVCGAWKKVSPELRKRLRHAIAVGGAGIVFLINPLYIWIKTTCVCLGASKGP